MPLDTASLAAVDTLRDGPGFDVDEYVAMHKIEDAVMYGEAINASFAPDPRATDAANAPLVVNNATLSYERARRMVTNWNLWAVPTPEDRAAGRAKGAQILYEPANFDVVYRLIGRWLIDRVNERSGATAPRIADGKVDPDTGEPATFPVDSADGGEGRVAG